MSEGDDQGPYNWRAHLRHVVRNEEEPGLTRDDEINNTTDIIEEASLRKVVWPPFKELPVSNISQDENRPCDSSDISNGMVQDSGHKDGAESECEGIREAPTQQGNTELNNVNQNGHNISDFLSIGNKKELIANINDEENNCNEITEDADGVTSELDEAVSKLEKGIKSIADTESAWDNVAYIEKPVQLETTADESVKSNQLEDVTADDSAERETVPTSLGQGLLANHVAKLTAVDESVVSNQLEIVPAGDSVQRETVPTSVGHSILVNRLAKFFEKSDNEMKGTDLVEHVAVASKDNRQDEVDKDNQDVSTREGEGKLVEKVERRENDKEKSMLEVLQESGFNCESFSSDDTQTNSCSVISNTFPEVPPRSLSFEISFDGLSLRKSPKRRVTPPKTVVDKHVNGHAYVPCDRSVLANEDIKNGTKTESDETSSQKSYAFDIGFDDQMAIPRKPYHSRKRSDRSDVIDITNGVGSATEVKKGTDVEVKENKANGKSFAFDISFGFDVPTKQRAIPSKKGNTSSEVVKDANLNCLVVEEQTTRQEAKHLAFDVNFDEDKPIKKSELKHLDRSKTRGPKCERTNAGDAMDELGGSKPLAFEVNLTEGASIRTFSPICETEAKVKEPKSDKAVPKLLSPANETTSGISFDVCLDFTPASKQYRKPKPTPKNIRFKKNKVNQSHGMMSSITSTKPSSLSKLKEQTSEEKTHSRDPSYAKVPSSIQSRRGTYTLDEVSKSLAEATEQGHTLEQALDSLCTQQDLAAAPSSQVSKRGTYTLDEVSNCLVAAADKGLTVSEALDSLSKTDELISVPVSDSSNTSLTKSSSANRGTYNLKDVSSSLDEGASQGIPLEEALKQLLDEVTSEALPSEVTKRGTYDLSDVNLTLEDAQSKGIPVLETLKSVAAEPTIDGTRKKRASPESVTERSSKDRVTREPTRDGSSEVRGVTAELRRDEELQPRVRSESSQDYISRSQSPQGVSYTKRGTYPLDDVAEKLEKASKEGTPIADSLQNLSHSVESGDTHSPQKHAQDSTQDNAGSRGTYTLDEVALSLELAKSRGIPIVQALNNISSETPGSESSAGNRNTYTLDEVASTLESAKEKGLPIVMALENLVKCGDVLRDPETGAVHRRQGKLINRKTYALASPLETIGENRRLHLFDGTTKKMIPAVQVTTKAQKKEQSVVKKLDFLTSACEVLLQSNAKTSEQQAAKTGKTQRGDAATSLETEEERRQRGTYSLEEVSLSLEGAVAKGIPVIDALGSMSSAPHKKRNRAERKIRMKSSKSEPNLNEKASKRSTREANSLTEMSSKTDISVIAALDELTDSLSKFSETVTPVSNGTFDRKERLTSTKSNSLTELEHESQDSRLPFSYPPKMRNSYSLDDVASALERSYETGVSFEDVLESMDSEDSTTKSASLISVDSSSTSIEDFRPPHHPRTSSPILGRTPSPLSITGDSVNAANLSEDGSSTGKRVTPISGKKASRSSGEAASSSDEDVSSPRQARRNRPFQLRGSRARRREAQSISSSSSENLGEAVSIGKPVIAKRGTYDLKDLSQKLDKSLEEGSTAGGSLEEISRSQQGGQSTHGTSESSKSLMEPSLTRPLIVKRGTYDLKDLSKTLDKSVEEGNSVNKSLEEISSHQRMAAEIVTSLSGELCDESVSKPVIARRGTYDLKEVSHKLDQSVDQGYTVNKSLEEISKSSSPCQVREPDSDRRGTYDLDHVSTELDRSLGERLDVNKSLGKIHIAGETGDIKHDTSLLRHRGTYDLDHVSEHLDSIHTSGSGGTSSNESTPATKANDALPVEDVNDDKECRISTTGTTVLSEGKAVEYNNTSGNYDNTSGNYGSSVDNIRNRAAEIAIVKALDELSRAVSVPNISARVEAHELSTRRDTYSLDDISKQLEFPTLQEQAAKDSTSTTDAEKRKRGTYSLEDIGTKVDSSLSHGIPVVQALDNISGGSTGEPIMEGSRDTTSSRESYGKSTGSVSLVSQDGDGVCFEGPTQVNEQESAYEGIGREALDTHIRTIDPEQPRDMPLGFESHRAAELFASEHNLRNISGDSFEEPVRDIGIEPKSEGSYLGESAQFEHQVPSDEGTLSEVLSQHSAPPGKSPSPPAPSDKGTIEVITPSPTGEVTTSDNALEVSAEDVEHVVPREHKPKLRPTWRPSGSVVDKLMSLVDPGEESGLSIVDILDQAAGLAERQGEIEETPDVNDDDNITAKHLALLKMQFEEKRRHIESEKVRNQEQWEEERRKLGQTAFWYMIGRAKGEDGAPIGPEQAAFMPPSEPIENRSLPRRQHSLKSTEPASPGQPSPPVGMSTPVECMSPRVSYQAPSTDPIQAPPSFGHGYHHGVPPHKPGHQSPVTGYQSPAGYQSPVAPHPSVCPKTGFQFPQQYPTDVTRTPPEHPGMQQELETVEFRLSNFPPDSTHDVPTSVTPERGPSSSPHGPRKCWSVNPAVPSSPPAFVPPASVDVQQGNAGSPVLLRGRVEVEVEVGDTPVEEEQTQKKAFAMFIAEDTQPGNEALTPEQQKRKEKFLRNRQKKVEEEKARKEAELEKKKRREEKQREVEAQRKLEEEMRRRQEEEAKRARLQQERLGRDNHYGAAGNDGYATYRPGSGTQPDDHSAFTEFSGPQCYVKPSGKSNRKLVINAISYVCLSGTVNKDAKERCLQAISESNGYHFMILFKDGLKFRGLYSFNPENDQLYKIFGIGPRLITAKMVEHLYKYSSGGKEFQKIQSKTLSISIDGLSILKQYWQSSKPAVASKTMSNLKRPPRAPQR